MIPFTTVAFSSINWLAVFAAAVASFVFGWLWYSPLLFGNYWMKQVGITKTDVEKAKAKGMIPTMLAQLVATFITASVLAMIFQINAVIELSMALTICFYSWLGFIATFAIGAVLWEKKSWGWYWLNALNCLLTLWILGAILVYWQ